MVKANGKWGAIVRYLKSLWVLSMKKQTAFSIQTLGLDYKQKDLRYSSGWPKTELLPFLLAQLITLYITAWGDFTGNLLLYTGSGLAEFFPALLKPQQKRLCWGIILNFQALNPPLQATSCKGVLFIINTYLLQLENVLGSCNAGSLPSALLTLGLF